MTSPSPTRPGITSSQTRLRSGITKLPRVSSADYTRKSHCTGARGTVAYRCVSFSSSAFDRLSRAVTVHITAFAACLNCRGTPHVRPGSDDRDDDDSELTGV